MWATANANGVEPVAYLTECLRNHEDLAKRPEHYLPWVYRDRLEALEGVPRDEAPPATGPPPREVQHPLRLGTHRARRPYGPGPAAPQTMAGLGPDG
jgi:hypothetical protein